MELSRKPEKSWGAAAGMLGLAFAACAACCAPLLAPLLAWIGLAGAATFALTGMSAGVGAAAVGVAGLMYVQRRRRQRRQAEACAANCASEACAPAGSLDAIAAPIACTLPPAAFRERAQWLREFTDRALVDHHLDRTSLQLLYRSDARGDVEKMVQQESACCAFLKFEVREKAGLVEVTVTVPDEAVTDAHLLFAHLLPSS